MNDAAQIISCLFISAVFIIAMTVWIARFMKKQNSGLISNIPPPPRVPKFESINTEEESPPTLRTGESPIYDEITAKFDMTELIKSTLPPKSKQ